MFPDSNYLPAHTTQPTVILCVALPISVDFLDPVFRQLVLPFRKPEAMPEVSIDKDSDFEPWENNIRPPWKLAYMDPIASTALE